MSLIISHGNNGRHGVMLDEYASLPPSHDQGDLFGMLRYEVVADRAKPAKPGKETSLKSNDLVTNAPRVFSQKKYR